MGLVRRGVAAAVGVRVVVVVVDGAGRGRGVLLLAPALPLMTCGSSRVLMSASEYPNETNFSYNGSMQRGLFLMAISTFLRRAIKSVSDALLFKFSTCCSALSLERPMLANTAAPGGGRDSTEHREGCGHHCEQRAKTRHDSTYPMVSAHPYTSFATRGPHPEVATTAKQKHAHNIWQRISQ